MINKDSCGNFAGIQDREVAFEQGLNILVGKNETGKSKIIDLIYQLLFHDIDAKKSDKSEQDYVKKRSVRLKINTKILAPG